MIAILQRTIDIATIPLWIVAGTALAWAIKTSWSHYTE
jgi:hypothetical protein